MSKRKKQKKKLKTSVGRTEPKPLFSIPLIFIITVLLMYILNIEIPIPISIGNDTTIEYGYLNLTITLYKVYSPDLQNDEVLNVSIIIKEMGNTINKSSIEIPLGVHRVSKESDITLINYSSNVILDSSKRYVSYLVVNGTLTGLILAYIDAEYTRSFDSLVYYYPYQFHFILRVQKCGLKIHRDNERVVKMLVNIINEDRPMNSITIEKTVNKTLFLDVCGDKFEIITYLSPIPFLTLKLSSSQVYLVIRESPLFVFTLTSILLLIFIKIYLNYIKSVRGG